MVFILKYLYPNSVYLLRGNHEFQSICSTSGFLTEIQTLFKNVKIFKNFLDVFSYLPFGALIQNKILCIHGGLSSEFKSIQQIKSIQKPALRYEKHHFLPGIVWSDPSEDALKFLPNPRGVGQLFGKKQLNDFLTLNNIQLLVRGHQFVSHGIETMFENKLMTIFSASNYCGRSHNPSGVLIVSEFGQVGKRVFPPLFYLKRDSEKLGFGYSNNSLITTMVNQPKSIINPKNRSSSVKIATPNLKNRSSINLSFDEIKKINK
jgi:protein phosphatase